jgi:hypothetical protein
MLHQEKYGTPGCEGQVNFCVDTPKTAPPDSFFKHSGIFKMPEHFKNAFKKHFKTQF